MNRRRRRTGKLKNCLGQSVVELGLITPLILVALYIPADFGIAFLTAHLTQNAVREGARIGSNLRSGDPSAPIKSEEATTIKNEVLARLPNLLSEPSINVKFYSAGSAATCMQAIEVSAAGSYNFGWYRFVGLFGVTPDPSVAIVRTTSMRYDYQRSANDSSICSTISFDQTYSG
jgi:Flp pilus assembly protein TadG